MKEITLRNGMVTQVDDADFEWLSQWRWSAVKSRNTYYAVRKTAKKTLIMHRVILGLTEKHIQCDHKDLNGLNNQRSNIRGCNNSQNAANKIKRRGMFSSRFKGVCWIKSEGRWRAQIWRNSKRKDIGMFIDEIEAAKAYDKAAKAQWGEFARTNF